MPFEKRLEIALSAGNLGWWALDLPQCDLIATDLCKSHYGRKPGDSFTYDELLQSIHPDDQRHVRQKMREALENGADYDVEYRCVWPDGTLHWVQVRGKRDHPTGQATQRMSGVSLDITARKLTETALAESEGRFRAAIDAVKGVLWTNDASGQMSGEQPGWAALTGQAQEEYQGYRWSNAIHPDDAQQTLSAWNAAVAERKPFRFEHRVRRRDGSWGVYFVQAIPVADSNGAVREWVGVHTDLTEQRATEQELARLVETMEQRVASATQQLRTSEARMRALFETSYQYFGELSPAGKVLDANATSLAGIEAALEDVIGLPFWDTPWFAGSPGLPEAVREMVGRVAEGEHVRHEITVNLPVGERIFDFSMRAVRARNGDIIALAPEAMDITERRRAEESFLQSQKLETLGQLTGGVAHDFNNLLTPIVLSLDLLRRKLDGDEGAQRIAAGGLQSAERAKTLVQRLLAFARRQNLAPKSIDVGVLVDGMRDLIERSIGPDTGLNIHIEKGAPGALVDPHQLELSILNLCINARDAMENGGSIAIGVACEAAPEGRNLDLTPGRYIVLTVTDTGVGMDADTAKRAVEPFFTTKELGKGTGLGLSMVHGLVAQLGGAMNIASTPGEGTCVSLWLPASAEEPVVAAPETLAAAEVAPSHPATVLLVDDEILVRLATAEMLRDVGYDVVEAASGSEARALVRDGLSPDILVTDQLMPGLKGTDLAIELRKARPGLKVLVITGYTDVPGSTLPRLTKPFRAAELVERVRVLIEGH